MRLLPEREEPHEPWALHSGVRPDRLVFRAVAGRFYEALGLAETEQISQPEMESFLWRSVAGRHRQGLVARRAQFHAGEPLRANGTYNCLHGVSLGSRQIAGRM